MILIEWEYLLTELVYRRFSRPLASILSKSRVTPNTITIIATVIGIASGFVIAAGRFYSAAALIFLSQILDCTDGDLARMTGKTTRKGAFLDRVFDRFVDAAIIAGIVAVSPSQLWLPGFAAIVASFGVSISRAMAEAEGAECKVGIGGRDTRLAVIMIGLVIGGYTGAYIKIFNFVLWLLFAVGLITTVHRILHTLKQLD